MLDAAAIFEASGPLARVLPAFEPRPQQARMAAEVMGALAQGRHLLVEAGTGVGKSLAYLVPAILWATRDRSLPADERRVIVSTHTRALQEQLVRKDLPILERALAPAGLTFRHALLMGSENYLCVQSLEQARLQPSAAFPGGRADRAILEALHRHAGSAPSGLRSEIPLEVPERLWARVRRDRDRCLGSRGPFWDSCLYRRDLARSREADLLVVNHALFFLDLATGGRVLPPHGAVVLDEAHRAEEAAIGQLGMDISDRTVARLLEEVAPARSRRRGAVPWPDGDGDSSRAVCEAAERVEEAAEIFFEDLGREAGSLASARGRESRLPRRARRGEQAVYTVRVPAPGLLDDRLAAPLERLEEALEGAARACGEPAGALALSSLAGRAGLLRERISLFLFQRMDGAVYWIESTTAKSPAATLHVTPVEVAPFLRQRLFEATGGVVLTSATLTAAGSFAHLRRRLGLTAATEVSLGSPYDFEEQALLYLPRTMPDPVAVPEEFSRAVTRECIGMLQASDGGAFVLFTSYALLDRVHAALAREPSLRDMTIVRHRPGAGAVSILEEFRRTRRGVLLGTLTFWQGVDVAGDALRCVIITRLPFEVPDHPLAEARGEAIRARGGDPFADDAVPEAILTFRQGFGRLIRSREDRGLVAVLDPRVTTRAYGEDFLASLPPCRRTDSIDEVARFFRAHPVS